MSIGDFTAFNNYLAILIFPIIMLGFMSNMLAQSQASFARIAEILSLPAKKDTGTSILSLTGTIDVQDIILNFGDKKTLKNVSFSIQPGSKTAIIGPTAAGKTQPLQVTEPDPSIDVLHLSVPEMVTSPEPKTEAEALPVENLQKQSFHEQVGFVFQDSNLFNFTLRENIAFSNTVDNTSLEKAIDTAELRDFIAALPG